MRITCQESSNEIFEKAEVKVKVLVKDGLKVTNDVVADSFRAGANDTAFKIFASLFCFRTGSILFFKCC